ncbi:MAG: TrkA family potassium uptake protein [Desulfobacterales bacterium]|jgi:trk system potassium uptake protein TrkA
MAMKPQVGVIGLGKFGYKFGMTLLNLGHNVLGIDYQKENINRAKKTFNQVFETDATQKQALEQIGVPDMTHILVSVGNSISASTMISMYLKELSVQNVWVKAIHEDHAKLLKKVGADEVIIPEHLAAEQLAYRIDMPGLIEKLPFDPDMVIREMAIEKLAQKTLREIDVTNRYNIQIIAIKRFGKSKYKFIPRADDNLSRGDKIIVIGDAEVLSKIKL